MNNPYSIDSAASQGLSNCHVCGCLTDFREHRCGRCGAPLHVRLPHSIQYTIALVITGFILYLPANMLPIMSTSVLGRQTANTIMGGVVLFWSHGDYPIALIIFVFSVVIPLTKMMTLAWLSYSVATADQRSPRQRAYMYRLTELVGRWSMLDVFVVAVLVALIQLGSLMSIQPGPAALAFAGMVIVTMFAAMRFDPRLIWDKLQQDH